MWFFLFDLASFFLPSYPSNMYIHVLYMYIYNILYVKYTYSKAMVIIILSLAKHAKFNTALRLHGYMYIYRRVMYYRV